MPHTIWKGKLLLFDVFCIPIRLCTAARERRLPFRMVYGIDVPAAARAATAAAGSVGGAAGNVFHFPGASPPEPPIPDHVAPVRRRYVGEDGVPLPDGAIFKAYEPIEGRFVVFSPAELKRLRAAKSSILPISGFVGANEIDPKYFDLSYDVWPDRGGEALYEMFFLALCDNGFAAVAELPLFGRERWVAVRPGCHGLVLHTLLYGDEVRLEDEYHVEVGRISRKDRRLAGEWMRAHRATFNGATLTNKYHQRVLALVADRWEKSWPTDGSDNSPQPAPVVVDIGEGLRRSLGITRKPPQREGPGRTPRKRKNRRGSQS